MICWFQLILHKINFHNTISCYYFRTFNLIDIRYNPTIINYLCKYICVIILTLLS